MPQGRGTELAGGKDMAGRRYRCNKCGHSWWYEEPVIGDVPYACEQCNDTNFDGADKARNRDPGRQRDKESPDHIGSLSGIAWWIDYWGEIK